MCLSNSQLTWPEVVGAKSRVNATDVSCRTQNMIACRIIVDVSVELKSQRAIIISNWLSNSQHAVIMSICMSNSEHEDTSSQCQPYSSTPMCRMLYLSNSMAPKRRFRKIHRHAILVRQTHRHASMMLHLSNSMAPKRRFRKIHRHAILVRQTHRHASMMLHLVS
jgi:hypothetical protein